jgi:hypothetical protein
MPGGGRLVDIPGFGEGVSWGNRSGQHAFLATLSDGTRGAYLIDAAGAISLILKEGMATNAGTVTALAPFTTFRSFTGPVAGASFGIALNNRGQVALPVQLDGSANAVLLLTPAPL